MYYLIFYNGKKQQNPKVYAHTFGDAGLRLTAMFNLKGKGRAVLAKGDDDGKNLISYKFFKMVDDFPKEFDIVNPNNWEEEVFKK